MEIKRFEFPLLQNSICHCVPNLETAYILLNAPLYPIFRSFIFLTVTSTPLFQHWLLYSNSTLFGVSLINLSSPFLKVITHSLFCQIKKKLQTNCGISVSPTFYQTHTYSRPKHQHTCLNLVKHNTFSHQYNNIEVVIHTA